MIPRVKATIDLNALSHNFNVIKNLIDPDTQIMAMVKANAYGHGLIDVARHLADANAFGVATLPEAIKLRNAGILQNIFVLCGFRTIDELELFSGYGLTAVVHHVDQIKWLSSVKLNNPISVWLKVDTGMHRLGVSPEEFPEAVKQLKTQVNVKQPFGMMTHLASADADKDFTNRQLNLFEALTQNFDNPKSIANSAGILAFKSAHQHLVRPGIILYGVSPFADKTGRDLGLKPVMTFSSSLVAYKKVKRGEYVGYGCAWRAPQDLMVGVVTAGYGDGYPRHMQPGAYVLMKGKPCLIIGHISMDLLAIDITQVSSPAIGDRIILWGEELPAEQVAKTSGTIAYELFCQLTERVAKEVSPSKGMVEEPGKMSHS